VADITQAFDESFQYTGFQVYLNSDYVECGYVWGGYVGGDGGTGGNPLKYWSGTEWLSGTARYWNGSAWV
jgi:hypothetical protein